jgi:hypothetical protein
MFYDQGLVVTLNTDNRLMSGTTVTDEYLRAHEALGFTWDELCASRHGLRERVPALQPRRRRWWPRRGGDRGAATGIGPRSESRMTVAWIW